MNYKLLKNYLPTFAIIGSVVLLQLPIHGRVRTLESELVQVRAELAGQQSIRIADKQLTHPRSFTSAPVDLAVPAPIRLKVALEEALAQAESEQPIGVASSQSSSLVEDMIQIAATKHIGLVDYELSDDQLESFTAGASSPVFASTPFASMSIPVSGFVQPTRQLVSEPVDLAVTYPLRGKIVVQETLAQAESDQPINVDSTHSSSRYEDVIYIADTKHTGHAGLLAYALSDDQLESYVAGALGPALASSPAASMSIPASGFVQPVIPPTKSEEMTRRLAPRVEKGGVLLPKGRTQIEPSFSYSHISKNRVGLVGTSIFDVIFIGEIRSEEIERDVITNSFSVRHGLMENLQVEANFPVQYQREAVLSGPVDEREESVSSSVGFNDINVGIHRQIFYETNRMPNVIAHTRVKIPTGDSPQFGSGVWGTKVGLTFVKTSDPVVLFSNFAYGVNYSGEVNGVDINPGNTFQYSAGIAYALNYNIGLNAGFEQIFVSPSVANGTEVVGSRLVVANLKTGVTIAFSKKVTMDLSVGAGLTEDSPDLSVVISFPFTF